MKPIKHIKTNPNFDFRTLDEHINDISSLSHRFVIGENGPNIVQNIIDTAKKIAENSKLYPNYIICENPVMLEEIFGVKILNSAGDPFESMKAASKMCICGHTMNTHHIDDVCIFSYNCDCEKFNKG